MKILCLDQATKVTGYSIWSNGELKKYGTLVPNYNKNDSYIDRMCNMCREIELLIKETRPNCVCIEDVQFQSNQRVFKVLSQLQGFIFAILDKMKIPFVIVEPVSWKSHIGIKAKKREEQKKQTIEFVKEKYNISTLTEDEADAIAIGCWATINIVTKGKEG